MGKRWSEEELEFIEKHWGNKSISDISKHLNRTYGAVLTKSERMNLGGATIATGAFTANQLAVATGVDHRTVRRWLKRGLPYKKIILTKKEMYFIKAENFWKWAKDRQHIDFRKIQRGVLIPEPNWLSDKINQQVINTTHRHNKPWSQVEDATLNHLLVKGKTYKQIGSTMGRTGKSIERRIRFLYYKARKGA
ncbi:hypothetical protein [Lysinibacillus sp. SGAir0095]|uniref:hypothetical protein n=1 Tax=Lysinibacillus sp. SGAir0095 TaxID=2070463 RepID=UPI0010CD6465|nr:hypothetical protein [Lysinibacillus sp. SGAir0095]QCR33145.1 hypothetical protein C1N55_13565 [Lysinibacillus sp. SGAir0095]